MENKTIVINRNDKNSKFDIYVGSPMKKDPDYYEQLTWRKKWKMGKSLQVWRYLFDTVETSCKATLN